MTEMLITGQCNCGEVRHQLPGPVTRQGICRCPACVRMTGALESPNIGVAPGNLEIVAGMPKAFKHPTSNEMCNSGAFHICPTCGSPLYWTDAGNTEIAVFVGTLDDTGLLAGE